MDLDENGRPDVNDFLLDPNGEDDEPLVITDLAIPLGRISP